MSEAGDRCIKIIARATLEEVRFDDLMSEASLIKTDSLPSEGEVRGQGKGICKDPLFVTFEDRMGMMESELHMGNQRLRVSLKRDRLLEGGVAFLGSHSPPLLLER